MPFEVVMSFAEQGFQWFEISSEKEEMRMAVPGLPVTSWRACACLTGAKLLGYTHYVVWPELLSN